MASSTLPSLASHAPSLQNGIIQGKTKAQLLREHRERKGTSHLPDQYLLRDVIYLLQGISGTYIKFEGEGVDKHIVFVEDQNYVIPQPVRTLVLKLSELGHLYHRVSTFVKANEGRGDVDSIQQSLCHHLQAQLTEYYKLMAVLESQMPTPVTEDSYAQSGPSTGLTLRRLDVWLNEWRLRMRMMSVCVEGCQEAHGGALVSLMHGYTDNGDPFIRNFTDRLLEEVSKPFFTTLQGWLFSGELHDSSAGFFVQANRKKRKPTNEPSDDLDPNMAEKEGVEDGEDFDEESILESGLRIWEKKFLFRREMLPSFVSEAFGKKIYSTGKSLNFVRYSCRDPDWHVTRDKLGDSTKSLKYSDIPGLERSIDTAYRIASNRLFEMFFDKFHLLDHLTAMRHYLMLGHGDFAEQLMETLGPSLSRPANVLYRHNLTATLEGAIRASNAQNDSPDVLRRLDARMMEYSHGEIGWDSFTLEYKVENPIDTVLDPVSMEKYSRLFNHLWQMKRVESVLTSIWARISVETKNSLKLPEFTHDWHCARLSLSEMIHFIRQMQAWCQLEVIECSWNVLLDFIAKKEGDLDALIDAHRTYLDRVVNKVLLMNPKHGAKHSKESTLLKQVRELFQLILVFQEVVESFFHFSWAEAARRDGRRDDERGVYTGPASPDEASDTRPEVLNGILQRLKENGRSFSEKAQTVVHGLQAHQDLDCRFLATRLSFSDFYKSKSRIAAQAEQTPR
ncbi:hypothetical protein SISNIDRAFT_423662 [Sistotremastrum niveocremeum HHB9708]|uniref:Uncharacterized protein n=1 Tax=Sistotremastrum niveocremeum HHB9708 TaxID=1314777 RepID=A0A164ZTX1_9AGAM|nr:hypothetical protein SISNIDRAFT_423662 [Sistotremastrum niveocremeum HHB9708]